MIRKGLKIVAIGTGVFLVLLMGVLIWASTHEDELKKQAVQALESGLLTDMNIGEIDYSVIEYFPNVSLVCNEVFLTDTYGKGDTLLWADEVSFELSLMKMLQGEYAFRQVRISSGGMHIHRDQKARDNYHFWKPSEGDSTSVGFELEKVRLNDIHFRMVDELSDVYIETRNLFSTVSGNITGDFLDLQAELETPSGFVSVEGNDWLPGSRLEGTVHCELHVDSSQYNFPSYALSLNGIALEGIAAFDLSGAGVYCSIQTNLSDVDVRTARALLPPAITQPLAGLRTDGRVDGSFSLEGIADGSKTPDWEFNGSLKNGYLAQDGNPVALDDIDLNVFLAGGGENEGEMRVSQMEASIDGNDVRITALMENFSNPWISGDLRADLDLSDVQRLFALDSIGNLYGEVDMNLQFSGRIPEFRDGQLDIHNLKASKLNGELIMDDVVLDLNDLPRPIESLNGKVALNGEMGSFKEVTLQIDETELGFEGTLSNLLPWLFSDTEVLKVDAICTSSSFMLASFLTEASDTGSSNDEDYTLTLPQQLDLTVDLRVEQFAFRDFEAEAVRGQAKLNSNGVFFEPLNFQTSGGEMELFCSAKPNANGIRLSATTEMHRIDLNELFQNFEDFGQEFITSAHLIGQCDLTASFEAQLDPGLNILPRTIVSQIDLKVENGELMGLQSMMNIAAYMRDNKLISPFVRADELSRKLSHVQFATLENQIDIRNGIIRFPTMDIKSSAMDITVSGTHTFDQHIDYSIALYLRDILIQKDQSEFGQVEDDGLGNRFFLSMSGTVDDPTFGYDRLARKEQKKQEWQEEKETFKELIRDQFSRKKEEKKAEEEEQKSNVTIKVDWGEEDEKKQEKPKEQEEKKKKRWKLFNDDEEEDYEKPPAEDDDDY